MTADLRVTSDAIRPGRPFSVLPVPPEDEVLVLDVGIGPLTALRARPRDASGRPTDARGTALLIPGFTGSKEDHLVLLPQLAARGWDTWTYSQRGQADSAAPDGIGAYRLEDFVGDAIEVARLLAAEITDGEAVHLLGHSFGGVVARATAIAAPDAFASLTMLCSGPHGWPDRKADLRERLLAGGGEDLWRLENPERAELDASELPEFDVFLRERSEWTSTDNLISAIALLADPRDTTDDLAATGLPVLVAHGIDDDAWPQVWQHTMAERLGARYAVIPGAGHLPNNENPSATAELLGDFWSSTSGRH